MIEKYKKLLVEKSECRQVKIMAYCIMINHAHLLVYQEDRKQLSAFMQKVNTSFAKFYNKRNEREGYVFKGRFFSQEIEDIKHLYNCLVYIHQNPVKAGIVEKIEDYPYTSYSEYFLEKEIISDESIALLQLEEKDWQETILKIHRNKNIKEEFDIKEYIAYQKIIEVYEKKYEKSIREIIKEKEILKKLVKELKEKSGKSIREIAKILEIDRNKVYRLLKKEERQ